MVQFKESSWGTPTPQEGKDPWGYDLDISDEANRQLTVNLQSLNRGKSEVSMQPGSDFADSYDANALPVPVDIETFGDKSRLDATKEKDS